MPVLRRERLALAETSDIQLESGTLALVTISSGTGHPTTLGPQGLASLAAVFAELRSRALRGQICAVAITGVGSTFLAGADVTQIGRATSHETARQLAVAGHETFAELASICVPTFAFLNGATLGGGLELALHCDYRLAASTVTSIGLPEVGLGLLPGWGGSYLLPRLVGIETALEVILTRALTNHPLTATTAHLVGLVDAVVDAEDFEATSLLWARSVLDESLVVPRRPVDSPEVWASACKSAESWLDATPYGVRQAPRRALHVVMRTRAQTAVEAFAAEEIALADLVMDDESRASIYAFSLVHGSSAAAPAREVRPVRQVGVVGAGLMSAQIALEVARHLDLPVVMRDVDDDRAASGLASVRGALDQLTSARRLPLERAARIAAAISATTELDDLAECDVVIEAVSEAIDVKRHVFAELESIVAPDALLATNTSALSVSQIADGMRHPGRVLGMHFFNPVSAMPLVEIVRAKHTDGRYLSMAQDLAARLGKRGVEVADRPGFVVNRLLVLLLSLVIHAADEGTPVEVADRVLDPLGLPMPPFQLLELVGAPVAARVLRSLRADLGHRFPHSPGLDRLAGDHGPIVATAGPGLPRHVLPSIQEAFGPATATDGAALLDRILVALTREIGFMLDEHVVADVSEIDRCMLLGGGLSFHLGGISPYLDRTGYSVRVLGRRFLPETRASVARSIQLGH